jgi:hypothetical protein
MFRLSWILFPVVLAALCLGCGLLVDRVAKRPIAPALLPPVGFAAVVVVATLLTVRDATSELAAPALAVAALAGFALALQTRHRALRPSAAWVWPAVAMAITFSALAAPVALTGTAGLSGYARIVDLASQVDLASYLVDRGRSLEGTTRDSSYNVVADQLLTAGYPAGAQAALGAAAQLTGIDPIWVWQPFMAWMGAMLALALYALLTRAIPQRGPRALAAGIAAQPTILYSYALTSGVKDRAVRRAGGGAAGGLHSGGPGGGARDRRRPVRGQRRHRAVGARPAGDAGRPAAGRRGATRQPRAHRRPHGCVRAGRRRAGGGTGRRRRGQARAVAAGPEGRRTSASWPPRSRCGRRSARG